MLALKLNQVFAFGVQVKFFHKYADLLLEIF